MWTIAAPAAAASTAEAAICSAVTGTRSLLAVVSPTPVIAQVTKTSQFIECTIISRCGRCEQAAHRPGRRGPGRRDGAADVRKPHGDRAEPREARRGRCRLRARVLRVPLVRALARGADDRAPPLAHGRDRQRGRVAGGDPALCPPPAGP